ncbi:hypothetical protein D0S48_08775 [Psychrobacillus sp. AK 1817]|uniref:hypothetical protein n=1 Tax=Psychrobacillus sp. AK 1817 TaxID=2303505 RepID=UPI0011AAD4FA|nr:hypothetical protein [Psychrobacillus sp. AK 1817]QEY20785.1 hypothetical protein D0S48_08775 [Psychrobacillus sp. AK 1817]
MNNWKFLSAVIILVTVMMIMPSKSNAASLSETEKLVQKAENAATVLKWEISLEHRKTKYADPVTLPNMNFYNTTKYASQLAYNAIDTLSAQEKASLTKRMESNVDIHLDRSMAYIDAITSGKKITIKTENLNESYRLNPLSDQTEQAYHDLSSEIRKQAILLYRVYGKSTRDAILDKYKSPGEKARQSIKPVISVKMEIDQLHQLIVINENKEKLLLTIKQIESNANEIQHQKVRQLVYTKLEEAKTIIVGNNSLDKSFLYLSGIIREVIEHPSKPIIYALNENKDVLEINYGTGKVRRLTMNLVPERIYFYNDELYVALLKGIHSSVWWNEDQEGAIAIINTSSFTLLEQFDIDMDPFDIVADGKSIYVSSGSGQWGNIKGYSRETLLETSKSGLVYEKSYLEMHPSLDKLYAITTALSPRDIESYFIVDGKISTGYDSPDYDDYRLTKQMTISPDGKYIFNDSGVVMIAADAKPMNMTYHTKLYSNYEKITFNMKEGFFYTSNGSNIDVYNYKSMEREKRYAMSGDIQNIFYQDGKLFVVSIEELYSTKLTTYAIKAYNVKGNELIQ